MWKRIFIDMPKRIFRFYYEGFRDMTVGKSLWILILVKLFLFFVVLKLFFFPNLLKTNYDTDEERAQAVRTSLTNDSTD
jgi:flagellar basal body-associated protein FliL